MAESIWSAVARLLAARRSDAPPPVHALNLLVRTRFAEDDTVLSALAEAEADHGNTARLRELADVLERAATRDPQFAHQVGVLTGQAEAGRAIGFVIRRRGSCRELFRPIARFGEPLPAKSLRQAGRLAPCR